MSTSAGYIVEIEAEPGPPPGHERGRATLTAFALALAVASAPLGRDGPEALAPAVATYEIPAVAPPRHLFISSPTGTERRVITVAAGDWPGADGRTTFLFTIEQRSGGGRVVGWFTSSGLELVDISSIPD